MNGYDLTNKMRKRRRNCPLTSTEQALYLELVAICNEDEWTGVFSVSNAELCNALQITEKTLTVARLALIQANLLFYKSGQSKRQFGKYSFEKPFGGEGKETTGNIPTKPTIKTPTTGNITTDNTANNTANVTANPTTNVTTNLTAISTDYNKLNQTKPNQTKISKSHSGAEAPVKEKKIAVHWKQLVDKWFTFYKSKFPKPPSFSDVAAKNLKSIVERLQKFSEEDGFVWTEETAVQTLNDFLNKAYAVQWLKENFLLENLSQKFDSIINSNGNSKSQFPKSGAGAKVTSSDLNQAFAKRYSKAG